MMTFAESDIIHLFNHHRKTIPSAIKMGIGDDAAIIHSREQQDIAVSIDTLNSGIHFPVNTAAFDIGHKSLAVSLSDMAAMGAKPFAVLLSLSLPEANKKWLADFANGFFTLLDQYGLDLIGGDTTRGPLSVSTVVHGWLPKNSALLRSGATPGDLVYVSGHLGDAGYALKNLNFLAAEKNSYLLNCLNRPEPRVKLGLAIQSIATAAIDISDGLVTDLKKILTASQVGATIYAPQIPLSTILREKCSLQEAWEYAFTSGDDYELCFTVPPDQQQRLLAATKNVDCVIHCIGEITAAPGLKILDHENQSLMMQYEGYEHFQE